ncbi:hypothetical protein B296_00001487 [Ensete ventricosum]|uniref:Uncharacterized protein n=1 Tax=Ensete ventricosum TaxID=4639 RepID=A0A427A095_ENSVE|nr:hypothetical protein B296_00001487 [Ensete ventricosum]
MLPLDVLQEARADLPVEEVVEEAAIVLDGLETGLLRNVVGGVHPLLFLDQRQDALSAKERHHRQERNRWPPSSLASGRWFGVFTASSGEKRGCHASDDGRSRSGSVASISGQSMVSSSPGGLPTHRREQLHMVGE